MRILAIDTAAASFSVAVTDGQVVMAERSLFGTPSHSRHVMTEVQRAVQEAALTIGEMDGFAVTRGPGSFTGLRIGISTAKGLSAATAKPMLGISSLRVLAEQSTPAASFVCPLLDAGKGEVYFALYRRTDHVLGPVGRERVADPVSALDAIDRTCEFIGPGALLYRRIIVERIGQRALFAPQDRHSIRASTLARLAWKRLRNGHVDDPRRFAPVYIRKADAERKRA